MFHSDYFSGRDLMLVALQPLTEYMLKFIWFCIKKIPWGTELKIYVCPQILLINIFFIVFNNMKPFLIKIICCCLNKIYILLPITLGIVGLGDYTYIYIHKISSENLIYNTYSQSLCLYLIIKFISCWIKYLFL